MSVQWLCLWLLSNVHFVCVCDGKRCFLCSHCAVEIPVSCTVMFLCSSLKTRSWVSHHHLSQVHIKWLPCGWFLACVSIAMNWKRTSLYILFFSLVFITTLRLQEWPSLHLLLPNPINVIECLVHNPVWLDWGQGPNSEASIWDWSRTPCGPQEVSRPALPHRDALKSLSREDASITEVT